MSSGCMSAFVFYIIMSPFARSYCISRFWQIIQAQYSQIPQLCVPLILHCLTLPSGADIFWKIVNDDFTSDDWSVRFAAGTVSKCYSH